MRIVLQRVTRAAVRVRGEPVAEIALHTVLLEAEAGRIEDDLLHRHYLRKHGSSAYYGQPRRP